MKQFLNNFLRGHLVWLFGSIFAAFILCFISKDMPNETAAGWFVWGIGSLAAYCLQAWYHNEYKTDRFDWFNFGLAFVVFVFAGVIRAFAE